MPASRTSRTSLPRSTVTREHIIEAATRIADEESIEALTIRRLAADVGSGAMTLYSYFRNKEEILDAIADHVLGGFTLPPAEETEPRAVVQSLASAFLRMMREHPSIVRLFTTRVTTSPDSLRGAMEAVVGRLREVGFEGREAVQAYGLIVHYTLGFASYQAPRPWGKPDLPDVEELCRQRTHFYSALPLAEFPNLVSLAGDVTTLPSDEQFQFGLDCLLDGLLRRIQAN
ncbi:MULTISPECIES: TetR/AcrR family transcriptional regulator [unclassified Micromonospora]|uniref:TetR/AcrR family transcriptional regulator n=1 Tax=unclassified Micromonospora TaxID=2617518 RepID=UPI00103445B4|nr:MULTISPECIES: TetR/AcrR family transcriptional regulator [unclassified Micromonospora]QKW13468.1 TetR/AcrR family transcriptional regulator [Verrucosispora sp. NA02020]TBL30151.1 TetR/AcrR family transcriptional regulator [Verrucosispora sp. SN26_14.1]